MTINLKYTNQETLPIRYPNLIGLVYMLLKCKVISGDVKSLIGQKIIQTATDEYGYADAAVDNVYADGTSDGEVVYNIVLAPETVNGSFAISTKLKLNRYLLVQLQLEIELMFHLLLDGVL